jgi:hypothetical protein
VIRGFVPREKLDKLCLMAMGIDPYIEELVVAQVRKLMTERIDAVIREELKLALAAELADQLQRLINTARKEGADQLAADILRKVVDYTPGP